MTVSLASFNRPLDATKGGHRFLVEWSIAKETAMKALFLLACTICGYTLAPPPEEKARDLAYCHALATQYRTYVEGRGTGHLAPSADVDAAIAKCDAGNTIGIRALEHALERAKIDLPPRN
jgi:hypothetical protein